MASPLRDRVRAHAPLLVVAASFVLWAGLWLTRTHASPYADLDRGTYTDHFSHVNAARAFARFGTAVWTQPAGSLGAPVPPEVRARLPRGAGTAGLAVRHVEGWPADKPLTFSWGEYARIYPAGLFLLVAPVALAYHFTPLTFAGMNLACVVLFLFYLHLSFYLVLRHWWPQGPVTPSSARSPVRALAVLFVYSECIHWTLNGFYDASILGPLALSGVFLAQRRPIASVLAYCVAAALHFRAYFFAPLPLFALAVFVQDRGWRTLRGRDALALAAIAVLAVASLLPFSWVQDSLRRLPVENVVHFSRGLDTPGMKAFALVVAVLAAVLLSARAWLDAAICLWMGSMLVRIPYGFNWYLLAPLAWLALPLSARHPGRTADARALFVAFASMLVFWYPPSPFWTVRLFGG